MCLAPYPQTSCWIQCISSVSIKLLILLTTKYYTFDSITLSTLQNSALLTLLRIKHYTLYITKHCTFDCIEDTTFIYTFYTTKHLTFYITIHYTFYTTKHFTFYTTKHCTFECIANALHFRLYWQWSISFSTLQNNALYTLLRINITFLHYRIIHNETSHFLIVMIDQ